MANQKPVPSHPPASTVRPWEELVVRTRFLPPALRRHIIARPRVEAIVARAMEYPLTVVKAEPGYGKTTAVASWLASSGHVQVWYSVGDTEADPRILLALSLTRRLSTRTTRATLAPAEQYWMAGAF